jgi:hypothetical protein
MLLPNPFKTALRSIQQEIIEVQGLTRQAGRQRLGIACKKPTQQAQHLNWENRPFFHFTLVLYSGSGHSGVKQQRELYFGRKNGWI